MCGPFIMFKMIRRVERFVFCVRLEIFYVLRENQENTLGNRQAKFNENL